MLRHDVDLGNTTVVHTVAYGPAGNPQKYACSQVGTAAHPAGGRRVWLDCTLRSGHGGSLHISVRSCVGAPLAGLTNCHWSAAAAGAFRYPPVAIRPSTLRFASGGAASTSVLAQSGVADTVRTFVCRNST